MNTGKTSISVLLLHYLIAGCLKWTHVLKEHRAPSSKLDRILKTLIHRTSEQFQPISHKESIVKNKIPLSFKTGSKIPSTEGKQESNDNCAEQSSTLNPTANYMGHSDENKIVFWSCYLHRKWGGCVSLPIPYAQGFTVTDGSRLRYDRVSWREWIQAHHKHYSVG